MNSSADQTSLPTRVASTLRRGDFLLALVVALTAAVLVAVTRQDVAFAVDQNNYLGGAQSLAEGRGYREAFVVGYPRCTIYPPAFPAYVALFWKLGGPFPANLTWLHLGQWLLSGASGGLLFLLLRQQGIAGRWSLPACLLFVSSDCWRIMINGFFSESLMQPLALSLLLWMGRPNPRGTPFWLVTGLLLGALYLTRSASTAIVGGVLLCVLWCWRRLGWQRLLAVFVPCLLAVLAWKWWTLGGSKTYASTFVEIVRDVLGPMGYLGRVGSNVLSVVTGRDVIAAVCPFWERAAYFPALTSRGLGTVLMIAVALGGAVLMAVGMVGLWQRRARGDLWVAAVAGLYLTQNILWWYWLGDRGMLVLLPLLFVWIHAGAHVLATRWKAPRLVRAAAAGLLLIGISLNLTLALRAFLAPPINTDRPEIEELGLWIRHHAAERDVIVATSDIPLAHFTHAAGRQVVGVPGSQIPVVPGLAPTLAVVRTHPNRYMPQPTGQGETLFTSAGGGFAVRRFSSP